MNIQLQYFAECTEEITQPEGEKTFTQEELNRIVSKRLAEEKQKNETDIAKREAELNKREFQLQAKELLKKNDLPDTLLDVLKGDDIETLNKSIISLNAYINEKFKITTRIEGAVSGAGRTTIFGDSDKIRSAMGL
ncbi:hypothetical protein AAK894_09485 [Lachnospiraceae bacterium 46-61]